jgi:pyruvate-formate lyase-activating enzyme
VVVDIQRFSLHDGPGIRTTVFFKGCVLRCRWCQNPEALRHNSEMSFYAERCVGSGQCAEVCEHHAIDLSSPARIDWERCTSCGSRTGACVHGAIRVDGQRYSVEALESELMKDEGFYVDSGGGVTLSGGEPMLHTQYLSLLLPRLKERGVHVTMETCGKFAWSRMEPLVEYLDLVALTGVQRRRGQRQGDDHFPAGQRPRHVALPQLPPPRGGEEVAPAPVGRAVPAREPHRNRARGSRQGLRTRGDPCRPLRLTPRERTTPRASID